MGSVPFDTADHAMIAPRRFRRAFMFNFDVRGDRSVFGICRNETVIALVYIARKSRYRLSTSDCLCRDGLQFTLNLMENI